MVGGNPLKSGVLFFEFFPAVLAVVSLIVAVMLFVVNRRAGQDPPRAASRPAVSPEAAAAEQHAAPRRPSMAP